MPLPRICSVKRDAPFSYRVDHSPLSKTPAGISLNSSYIAVKMRPSVVREGVA